MLGISVYLSNQFLYQQEAYIRKMNQLGFRTIFTSLHIPEENPKTYRENLAILGKLAKKYNMELFADISPKSLNHLGLTWENAHHLQKWGVTGLRVDYGVRDETIAFLSNKIRVALNASTIIQENLENLRKHNANFSSIEAWHNYYPRPETGLGSDDFNAKNQFLKTEGLTVMAFIPGDGNKRGPLFKGLPTLEAQRNRSTFSSFIELKNNQWIDKILIGDPSISKGSERQFTVYQNGTILLRAKCFTDNASIREFLQTKQTNRMDAARDVIRSEESRQSGLNYFPIKAENTAERTEGTITVDNENYGRYQGEIQITKRTLPADEKVNVIGRIIEEDRPILPYIKGGTAFQIEWID